MEKIRMEYQKMIDQSTSIYATIYSGIVVFSAPQLLLVSANRVTLLIVIGALLFAVSSVWLMKVNAWNRMLKAELKYKAKHDKEFREYNEFIVEKMQRKYKGKRNSDYLFASHTDNLIPLLLFLATALLLFVCLVLSILQ